MTLKFYTSAEFAAMNLEDPTTVQLDDDGCVMIHVEGNPAWEYWIEPDRIDTPEKCIVWLLHLADKKWGTPQVLNKVAVVASNAHGYSLPWGC